MTLLLWLGAGLLVGVLAKRIIPRLGGTDWLFAAAIAIVGAFTGGFAGEVSGMSRDILPIQIVVALAGAVVVLYFFRQYMTDATNSQA